MRVVLQGYFNRSFCPITALVSGATCIAFLLQLSDFVPLKNGF